MSINGVIEKDIYIGIYIIVLFVTLSISTSALGFGQSLVNDVENVIFHLEKVVFIIYRSFN